MNKFTSICSECSRLHQTLLEGGRSRRWNAAGSNSPLPGAWSLRANVVYNLGDGGQSPVEQRGARRNASSSSLVSMNAPSKERTPDPKSTDSTVHRGAVKMVTLHLSAAIETGLLCAHGTDGCARPGQRQNMPPILFFFWFRLRRDGVAFSLHSTQDNLSASRFRTVQSYNDPTMVMVADPTRSED